MLPKCYFGIYKKSFIFAPRKRKMKGRENKGALAHPARALDWQSKGDEFESRMLHDNL